MPLLRPFFTFYGGKYRAAPKYPAPLHPVIVEPFAGSAGYAMRYPERQVVLVERDPVIAALWKWLTVVPADRVRALPLEITDVRLLPVEPEAKSLIGFWLNKGTTRPSMTPSAWMRKGRLSEGYWGESIRERVASQVDAIRHWTVIEGDYTAAGDREGTWFIDPPYQLAGTHYRYGAKGVDFTALGTWCRSRQGQVIVCENEGAKWLPFRPFLHVKANESKHGGKVSKEAIWVNTSPDGTPGDA